jgi:hypothetical protein
MSAWSSRPVRLSPCEFTACWDALDLGDTPVVLSRCGPGNGFDAAHRRDAMAALVGRGLSDGVRPHPSLAEPLRLLAHPDYSLDIRFGAGPTVGLGAIAVTRGVTATMTTAGADGPLELTAGTAAPMAATLLGLLAAAGPVTPGVGRPVNIPAETLDRALADVQRATDPHTNASHTNASRGTGLWAVADRLEAAGIPRIDAASMVRMCEGMWCRGQLGVTAHFGGPPRRAPWVIGFHATPAGWFMQLRRDSTVTICPTDTTRLLRHWHDLVGAPCG